MAATITVGSIIILQNDDPNGGYLDTYGWVAAKPEFWNVSGTERIFVSTYKKADRGGGTTSWQMVSADGKQDGEPLHIGDRVHLRNMYPDAGYLDCCGWIEDLGPFREPSQGYIGNVRCGVFTSGAPNRDNGTGIWTIQAADKTAGAPLYEGDAISLVNGYPENRQPVDNQHAETGSLVAYGEVKNNAVFGDFQDRQLLVFTSITPDIQHTNGIWNVTLSPAYKQDNTATSLFDFFRPELLKGRTHSMESVSNMTTVVLLDAFQAISGVDVEKEIDTQLRDTLLQAKSVKNSPTVIDYDFQVAQLWNLFTLSKILKQFDQSTLQVLMRQLLTTSQTNKELPPLDLVRTCFQCVATDHEIIQHATMQRRWNKVADRYDQSAQAVELMVMDKLAINAVTPFQHLLTNRADHLAVITYFSEKTQIHHLPYTDQCILIGVNYDRISPNDMSPENKLPVADTKISTDINAPTSGEKALTEDNFSSFELMAIPHEVGHYMYQHGKINNQTFQQIGAKFKNKPYYRWCEEIFADVYGCIIAGPLCIFSMQAFLTSGERKRAWKDDDEHPTPILRPFILSEILRELCNIDRTNYNFSTIADHLDADWSRTLEKWGYERVNEGTGRPARIYLPDDSSMQLERIINVDRVIKSVQEIIKEFATLLLDSREKAKVDLDNLASVQQASSAILWRSSESQGKTETEKYAREMALLTGAATASASVSPAVLLDIKTSVDASQDQPTKAGERLQAYVDVWGDKGPTGSGIGTY